VLFSTREVAMKRFTPILTLLLLSCSTVPRLGHSPVPTARATPFRKISVPTGLHVYDHIVIVIEENKNYEEIIGNAAAPFINQLKNEGADLTQMYAEEHNSEGNYFWLFSGSNQNVGFSDRIPPGSFTARNLGEQLIASRKSFRGYSEDLPNVGSTVKTSGHYARKHVPWVSFSNLVDELGQPVQFNFRFADFPENYKDLPTVSFVIPNLIHDMHDDAPHKPHSSIHNGDDWLEKKLGRYYQWAKKNNSLLILTFDEDDHGSLFNRGLTDPGASTPARQNRIVTILAGAHIKHGEYPEGRGITHVNLLRTLEAMYGLERSGDQQPFALQAGIADDIILKDVFEGGS
jgi:acid phosphatase